jgi:hypothetical protein
MFKQGIKGVDFVCNTDSQALQSSSVPNKIQLGVNLTEGLGAGANPDVGQSAIESIAEIERCWIEIPRWFYHCRDGWWYRYRCGSSNAQLAKTKEKFLLWVL